MAFKNGKATGRRSDVFFCIVVAVSLYEGSSPGGAPSVGSALGPSCAPDPGLSVSILLLQSG